jgi:2-polyprenyl-3-methyl-5-hydroxy-6-metoxy-1,4-benzoquinol methylase
MPDVQVPLFADRQSSGDEVNNPHEVLRALRRRYEAALQLIKDEASKYKFYHNIEIVPGLVTAGLNWADGYVNRIIAAMEKHEFAGKRVLDVGCRDGALSFVAERMGRRRSSVSTTTSPMV